MRRILNVGAFALLSIPALSFTVCDSCTNELNSLLDGVFIPIPSQNLTVSGFGMNLTNISCGNVVVPHINVAASNDMSVLTFQSVDTALSCDASYQYQYLSWPYFPWGSGQLNVTANSSLTQFEVAVTYNTEGIPMAMNVTSCSSNLTFQTEFSGAYLSQALSSLFNWAEDYVKNDVDTAFCTEVSSILDVTGAELLARALNTTKSIV